MNVIISLVELLIIFEKDLDELTWFDHKKIPQEMAMLHVMDNFLAWHTKTL